MKQLLFKHIDNAPLIIFRIFFGFLIACESFGAILTGWVKNVLIEPQFTFSFIGLDWLQPLPGFGMYAYFVCMGLLGIAIMLGFRYKFAIIFYTVLWAGVYFMQKTSYNNHYYLLLIISFYMIFFPANQYASLDVKQQRVQKQNTMPNWVRLLVITQVAIVYFYATIAKFYPDWLNGTFTKLMLEGTTSIDFLKQLFAQKLFYLFLAYAGILFDLLIIPFLLFKKTRTIALIASLIFHLFNAVFLQIGIFPFFALTFSLFFYPTEKIRTLFLKKKPKFEPVATLNFFSKKAFLYLLLPFLAVQLLLPLRHHFIKGDVLWTEEGHRLSWRMMLRSRDGFINFMIKNNDTGEISTYDYHKNLTSKQARALPTKPDFIWQYCQKIKEEYRGKNISIFIDCKNNINNGAFKTLIDPKQDFVKAKWNYFWHNEWILLY
jgi:vitamin K-dependent gamma-carboxylase